MSFLRSDDEEWLRTLPEIPRAPVAIAPRCFERRGSKGVRLDDLIVDDGREKRRKLRQKERLEERREEVDDDDDDPSEAQQKIDALLKKCSEMGDESSMMDAPKWGEQVFGAQQEFPACPFDPESIRWITTPVNALASRNSFINPVNKDDGEAFLLELLANNWLHPLVLHGVPNAAIACCLFNKMAYTSNKSVQQTTCVLLCDYFAKHGRELDWHPDFAETFRVYGYLEAPISDAAATGVHGPPSNFSSTLKCLRELSQARIFQKSDCENYLIIMARCLLDRRMLPYFCAIQDCIAALIGCFAEEEWENFLPKIASSLARVSTELVNVVHVIYHLRGARERILQLRRETAFEALSVTRKLSRQPKDVISSLKSYDVKGNEVDFVELYYHLDLADMWLRHDPLFKSDTKAFSSWMSLLRKFSVRIFCGDYRTFANKVRNRAAFLISVYSESQSDNDSLRLDDL